MRTTAIKVAVAAHKEYRMPEDPMYLPVFVGAALRPEDAAAFEEQGWARDDRGDEISAKNPGYCELTALYWVSRNTDAAYKGLVHYRRHFQGSGKGKDPFDQLLTEEEAEAIFKEADLIVPEKRHYVIATLYSHYAMTHYAKHLDLARAEIRRLCPEYLPAFDRCMKMRSGHMFNMLIARADLLECYLDWLFPILAGIEEKLRDDAETEELSAYQGRLYGRVSEILFNVWLYRQYETGGIRKDRVRELPCLNMEGTNWPRKISAFLKAKLFRQKYSGSF